MIPVGYWAEGSESGDYPVSETLRLVLGLLGAKTFPRAQDCVDCAWAPQERAAVIRYLERGQRHEGYMGVSACRFCGCDNGCWDLTDGRYVWPEGFAHYLRAHGVKAPSEFVAHALAAMEA